MIRQVASIAGQEADIVEQGVDIVVEEAFVAQLGPDKEPNLELVGTQMEVVKQAFPQMGLQLLLVVLERLVKVHLSSLPQVQKDFRVKVIHPPSKLS